MKNKSKSRHDCHLRKIRKGEQTSPTIPLELSPQGDDDDEQQSVAAGKPRKSRPISSEAPVREDDSDDDDLHAAAAAWAARAADEKNGELSGPARDTDAATPPRSVHITQISFQVNQLDLHRHFAAQGCLVSSVRLVYDQGLDRQRQFRGVAFVDLANHDSYLKALELDKSILLGRKINVRPTKSAQELSNIVQATRGLIASKIRSSKSQSKEAKGTPTPTKRTPKASKPGSRGSDRKLTKKERNKRAAILRQKRSGQRS